MADREHSPHIRAAIYLRISQDHTGEALGVTRQLEDCTDLARALGWEVVEVYTDNDVSATSGKARPAYRTMLADIDAGSIGAIIAWHADRLYRKATDLGELVDICKRNNTQIATVRAGTIDLTTPTGRLVAGLLAQVATYEGEAKADRWKRSWRQGREAGTWARTGTRLYGYTRDGVVVPEEAEIARRIVRDHLAGVSLMQIADELDREDIRATRGGPWRTGTLRQYLNQPRIAGFSTLNGEIVGEGDWEPLIDRETWEELQAVLMARAKARPPRVALLGGLVFCGKCGHRLITSKARKGRIYRCPNRPGMRGCGGVSIYAEPVEEIIEAYARERLSDPRVLHRLAELRTGPAATELVSEVLAIDARIDELEATLEDPGVPVARILLAVDKLKARREEAQGRIADAVRASAATPYVGGMQWPTDLGQRRDLVALALGEDRVEIRPVGKIHNVFDPERVQIVAPEG